MKYDLISFNTTGYNEQRITDELNKYLLKFTNSRIVTMCVLANGWTRFLIEYSA